MRPQAVEPAAVGSQPAPDRSAIRAGYVDVAVATLFFAGPSPHSAASVHIVALASELSTFAGARRLL